MSKDLLREREELRAEMDRLETEENAAEEAIGHDLERREMFRGNILGLHERWCEICRLLAARKNRYVC